MLLFVFCIKSQALLITEKTVSEAKFNITVSYIILQLECQISLSCEPKISASIFSQSSKTDLKIFLNPFVPNALLTVF